MTVSKANRDLPESEVKKQVNITMLEKHHTCKTELVNTNPHALKEKNHTGNRHRKKDKAHFSQPRGRMDLLMAERGFLGNIIQKRTMSAKKHKMKYKTSETLLVNE